MNIGTVAILSPGDMGHAVGQRLRENELDVITCHAWPTVVTALGAWQTRPAYATFPRWKNWSSSRT